MTWCQEISNWWYPFPKYLPIFGCHSGIIFFDAAISCPMCHSNGKQFLPCNFYLLLCGWPVILEPSAWSVCYPSIMTRSIWKHICIFACCVQCKSSNKLLPDPEVKKLATISSQSLLPLSIVCMRWCICFMVVLKCMSLGSKILQGGNTLYEKESFPIRNSDCYFLHLC